MFINLQVQTELELKSPIVCIQSACSNPYSLLQSQFSTQGPTVGIHSYSDGWHLKIQSIKNKNPSHKNI